MPRGARPTYSPPRCELRQIKAVRYALVVRSSQFERGTDAEGRAVSTTGDTNAVSANLTIPALFPCNGLPGCTGELSAVTLANTAGFRYRVFEQIVPLRNQIWNPS
jgi:hypothetical protein